jgi:hypothetical protein
MKRVASVTRFFAYALLMGRAGSVMSIFMPGGLC